MRQASIQRALEPMLPIVIQNVVVKYATLTREEKVDYFLRNKKENMHWTPEVGSTSYAVERSYGLTKSFDCFILQQTRENLPRKRLGAQLIPNLHVRECLRRRTGVGTSLFSSKGWHWN